MERGVAAPLILASTSPRRRQILASSGLSFSCIDPGPDAEVDAELPSAEVIAHATAKLRAAQKIRPDAVLIAADTLVFLNGSTLGKPQDRSHARAMLVALQEAPHEVWTGCAVAAPGGAIHSHASRSLVRFDPIPESALSAYLDSDEWRDKAGAYGIQGPAGAWAKLVQGRRDTVIGLDLEALFHLLTEIGACPDRLSG